jgi:hypothetical protein
MFTLALDGDRLARHHSITSSARAMSIGGASMPGGPRGLRRESENSESRGAGFSS